MNKARRKQLLKLAIGLGIVGFIIYLADLEALGKVLARVNKWVFLSLPLFYVQTLFKSLRWTTYLRYKGVRLGHWESYVLYTQSMLLGLISPGRIGELYRSFTLSRRAQVSIGFSFASVVIDRCADVFMLSAIGFGGIGILWSNGSFAQAVAHGPLIAPAAFVFNAVRSRVIAIVERLSRGRALNVQAEYAEFKRAFTGFGFGLSSSLAILTLVSILSHAVQLWIIAVALEVPMSFGEIFIVFSASFLINLIPISVNGIGTREAFIVALLPTMGVDRETAVGFALMFTLIQFSNIVMCLPFWFARDKDSAAFAALNKTEDPG